MASRRPRLCPPPPAESRGARTGAGLERLALWCNRFTPCCAVDGEDGLLLDIAGAAHLFGGEAAMVAEVEARIAGLGFEARTGLADMPGAAWALARFGEEGRRIAAPGGALAALRRCRRGLGSRPKTPLLRRLGYHCRRVDGPASPSLAAARFGRRERSEACCNASTARSAAAPTRSRPYRRRPPASRASPSRSR